MKGKLFGVGVGPGDPELLTVKAIKTIQNADYVAVPDSGSDTQTALKICKPYLENKEILHCYTPMTRDTEVLQENYYKNAELLKSYLDQGKNIAFLTLGDPTIYSTYIYIQDILEEQGYPVEIIPGITSFCAAAAKLNISLCEKSDPLHIIPASYEDTDQLIDLPGTKVFMKSGRKADELLDMLEEKELLDQSFLVERCGLPGERVLKDLSQPIDDLGYFTIIITKED